MKRYKKIVYFFLLIIVTFISTNVFANDNTSNQILPQKSNIECDKTFEITFNQNLAKDYINNDNFFVSTDENGINKVSGTSVELSSTNTKKVKLNAPVDGYMSGKTYYLFVKTTTNSYRMTFDTISYLRDEIPNSKRISYQLAYKENDKIYTVGDSLSFQGVYDVKGIYYITIDRKASLDTLINLLLGEEVIYTNSENQYLSGNITTGEFKSYSKFTTIDKTFTSINDGYYTIKYFNDNNQFVIKTETLNKYVECIPINNVFDKLGLKYSIERDDTNKIIYFKFDNVDITKKLTSFKF